MSKPVAERTPLTLAAAIERLSHTDRGFTFLGTESGERHYSFADIRTEVKRRAGLLRQRGVAEGDRVALVIPAPEDFVLSFLAVVFAGAVPVPMYPPLSRGKLDTYLESATKIMLAGNARWLLTSKQVEPILWTTLERASCVRDLLVTDTLFTPEASATPPTLAPRLEDVVFLQFTSGSTSDPKGVRVTHASLFDNTKTLLTAIEADGSHDHGVSWLPLYHDMGLIGFVLGPLMFEVPVTFIPTMRFIKRPTLWLDVLSEKRGTITFAPNFAYALLAKRVAAEHASRWDLSSLKVAGCGAEPIQAETMHRFADHFAPAGFKRQALLPCFGMAEATLAVSFKKLGDSMRVDRIRRDDYEQDKLATPTETEEALSIVSCGAPLPGYRLKIVDASGRELGERQVGELCIAGGCVADGYDQRPEATAAAFKDGWLHSGDLGYLADGELYICGRKKDLIIVNGRNYYPQTLEWAVEAVAGVRKGNVVAFSVPADGSEALVVALESKTESREDLVKQVRRLLTEQFGLSAQDVAVLAPGTLPKTSSGKVQRQRTRSMYMARALGGDGVRTLGTQGKRLQLAQHLVRSYSVKIKRRLSALWSSLNGVSQNSQKEI